MPIWQERWAICVNMNSKWWRWVSLALLLCLTFVVTSCDNAAKTEEKGIGQGLSHQQEENLNDTSHSALPVIDATPGDADWDEKAEAYLQKLTLEEKAAQLFCVTPEGLTHFSGTVVQAGETTRKAFNRLPVGGILYHRENLKNPKQTQEMLQKMQSISKARIGLSLFLCVDEEGGSVSRVFSQPAFSDTPIPPMREIGFTKDPTQAEKIGTQIGEKLHTLGFNVDFAPVADVLSNPDNALLKSRSFGADVSLVTKMCAAFCQGLEKSDVLPAYKHFPGHGSTSEDSHSNRTVSQRMLEELRQTDLVPFQDAIAKNCPFIMVGHVSYPQAFGEQPASLNKKVMMDLARNEMHFQGILITDAINMGAITENYDPEEAVISALQAGADMILMPDDLDKAVKAVVQAVNHKQISESRLDTSLRRILRVKTQRL